MCTQVSLCLALNTFEEELSFESYGRIRFSNYYQWGVMEALLWKHEQIISYYCYLWIMVYHIMTPVREGSI